MTLRLLRPWPLILSVLGLVLAGMLALEIAGWPFLKAPLEARLSQRLQRQVQLGGEFRLQLLGSIRLRVGELRIAPPDWERDPQGRLAPPFIQARDARLVLPYSTLLDQFRSAGRPLHVRRLEVGAIDARLRRLEDGRANWRFAPHPDATASGREGAAPEFVHLIVHKGQLSLTDAQQDLVLRAQVRTREGSARDAAGLFVRASGHWRRQPFTVEARSPGILPLVAPPENGRAVALGLSARLAHPGRRDSEFRFRGRARDLLRFDGLQGDFRVAGPSLAAAGNAVRITLPSTDAFFMQGRINKEGKHWEVNVGRFDVGDTHLSGRFRYETKVPRPLLSGELHGRQLVLRDLAPAFGASPPPPGPDEPGSGKARTRLGGGKVLPQRDFDIPSLQRMDAQVAIDIDKVDLGSDSLKPLQPLVARLTLQDGVLRLEQLLARTAQGQLQGNLQMDSRQEIPVWSGDLRWNGIALSDWVRARNPLAQKASEASPAERQEERQAGERRTPHFLTGELAGEARFQGQGRSTATMLASLDGHLYLWIRDGTVSHLLVEALGLDIAQGLGLVIRGDRNLPLRCAAMSLKAKDGLLSTDAGIVDTPDTLLLLNGKISLAEERFHLRIEARPHDRSLLSIRSPLQLRGNFADPQVRPDLQKLGGKAVLASVLGSLLTPLAALLPLVDPGESPGSKGCAQTLARLREKPGTPAAMKRAVGDKQ